MNRGNMGKQISNAPKSKSKKVKKMFGGGMATAMPRRPNPTQVNPARPSSPRPGMATMASSPEAVQAMAQRPLQPGQTRISATPGAATTTNDPRMLAAMQRLQASGQRPNAAPMQEAIPDPRHLNPARPGQPTPRTQSGMMQAAQMNTSAPQLGRPGQAAPRTQSGMMQAAQMQRPGGMAKGGAVKKMAKGGKIDGCCMRGKTKGKMC